MDGEAVIAILLGAALAIFSLVIAGYPIVRDAFFRPAERADDGDDAALAPDGDDAAGIGAESIYDAIETLELDYQLGNLPEAEYRRQLQAYRVEAAEVIRAQLERGPDAGGDADAAGPESRLEREVMSLRRPESRADAPDTLPADTAAACPECDAPIPAGLRGPCPGCGAARR